MEASTSLWQAPHGNKQPPVRSAGWWARKTSGIIQSTSQGPRTQAPMSATGKDRCPSSVEGHLPSVHHFVLFKALNYRRCWGGQAFHSVCWSSCDPLPGHPRPLTHPAVMLSQCSGQPCVPSTWHTTSVITNTTFCALNH